MSNPPDPSANTIPEEVLANHAEAVSCALKHGEVPLEDGTWRAADGRIIDPQLGDGRLVPLNVGFLYGLPVVVAIAVPVTALTVGLSWIDLVAFVAMWLVTGMAITAGYHRLFSHRTYKAAWPVRAFFAVAGCMAVQNSILTWSRDHRYHHGQVDTIGDPYNARRGFWFSHFTWVLRRGPHSADMSNVDDLKADPIVAWQHRNYDWLVWTANIVVVLGLGWLTGRWIQMFVIVGLLRILFVQHGTFLINSWAHKIGTRPWNTQNTARDSWFLSFLTFGEGYHNYHHAFASDYRNGIYWYHWDPSKWLIGILSKLRLAWDLKRVPLEVALSQRVQETRKSFATLLYEAGEGCFDDWAEGLRRRRADLITAVEHGREELLTAVQLHREGLADAVERQRRSLEERRELLALQIIAAEKSVEDAISDLRLRRRLWRRCTVRADLRGLNRAVRDGQRDLLARWSEFERLVAQYKGLATAAPAMS